MTPADDIGKRELSGLDPGPQLGARDLDALFARVAADTVDRVPNVRDRARELRTWPRIALAVSGALLMGIVMLLVSGVKADLSSQVVVRYAVAMTGIAALVGVMFAVSMRGLYQKPVGGWVWGLIAGAALVPVVLAVMPWLWETGAEPVYGGVGVPCLVLGVVTGALTASVAWIFQRETLRATWRMLAAAAGGGLTAFAMLQLHCPARDATHLLVGHAGAGLVLVGVVAVAVWLRRRTQAR